MILLLCCPIWYELLCNFTWVICYARLLYHTNGHHNASAIITSSSILSNGVNTPTYWVNGHVASAVGAAAPATATFATPMSSAYNTMVQPQAGIQQRRTASSGLLMNIGYLDQTDPAQEENLIPRPASAGAMHQPATASAEQTVLYDYPASKAGQRSAAGRHRGLVSLRKQHSVSCASSHCCENGQKLWCSASFLHDFLCVWLCKGLPSLVWCSLMWNCCYDNATTLCSFLKCSIS